MRKANVVSYAKHIMLENFTSLNEQMVCNRFYFESNNSYIMTLVSFKRFEITSCKRIYCHEYESRHVKSYSIEIS